MSSADLVVIRRMKEATLGVTPNNSTKAVAVLTGSANFADAETVTIGAKVYTMQTTLTNVDGHVKIGADLTASLLNLKNAINVDGSGVEGTDFATATNAHTGVEATASNATTLSIRAINAGVTPNSYATTETSTNAAWGGSVMSGGADSSTTTLTQTRFTGESLNFNIENTKSAEITPTRVETDLVQVSAAAAGDINTELSFGSYDDLFEGLFCNTWGAPSGGTADLVNGTTRTSFTIQKHFSDMVPEQFHTYTGCLVESLNLKMELGKIVEGSFSLMAMNMETSEVQIAGATLVAAPTTPPMNAITNIQNFMIEGVPYSGCISKLSLVIKNNVRAIMCIGSISARNMKLGTFEVTGDMEFYFEEGTNYKKFRKGTEFDFSFDIVDELGNRYGFDIQRAKFETGEVVAGGKNTDVMFAAKWRGLYDGTSGRVIRLQSTPAV
jgi:hypothetical protein